MPSSEKKTKKTQAVAQTLAAIAKLLSRSRVREELLGCDEPQQVVDTLVALESAADAENHR